MFGSSNFLGNVFFADIEGENGDIMNNFIFQTENSYNHFS
jgi:hypothetical protein